MNNYLLLTGVIIMICILLNKYLDRLPVPSLLIFIGIGMLFGENGIFGIAFDDYSAADTICSISLVFIMFYGGFGINVKEAKPVAVKAVLLSTFGVVMTAGLTGAFVHFVLKLPVLESMLIGSVIASTDAASVFNILRSQKLALKYNTSSLLEMESGSNDPISYMLTVIFVSMMSGSEVSVPMMLFKQIFAGALAGAVIGKLAVWKLQKNNFGSDQSQTIFVFAAAIIAYALPTALGGNGYLSVYLCGMIMGNATLPMKRYLVHFFDVLTNVVQVLIFFLLGLLVTPVNLPAVFIPALLIMLFMTFIARPVSVVVLLAPFKSKMRQIGLVSWAGLRGVASIVFAILAVLNHVEMRYNLFNLVFCIVLLSITFQGTLLPWMSYKMSMIDIHSNINKTFNDYQEESDISFIKVHIKKRHPWANKQIKNIPFGSELLVAVILRGGERIVPNGNTQILPGDLLVIAAKSFEDREEMMLQEFVIDKNSRLKGKLISELPASENKLIITIKRGEKTLIPRGNMRLEENDILVEVNWEK